MSIIDLNHLNIVESIKDIKKGQLIIIQRKIDKKKIIVLVKEVIKSQGEVVISGKNDYFNFDMYLDGSGWVHRVWALPDDVQITCITNNINEFPR